ncbi:MAG: hypothetical protein ABJC61_06950 [Acidobacteriota bacterium]
MPIEIPRRRIHFEALKEVLVRKTFLLLASLALLAGASTAYSATGTGEVIVNTNTTVSGTLTANTTLVIVGWAPVVNSMNAAFGSINAYVNVFLPFATITVPQQANVHFGQFTAAAGPPIILYPAWQQNGAFHVNNNGGSTVAITFGCVGGGVTGASLINVRTIPAADPQF